MLTEIHLLKLLREKGLNFQIHNHKPLYTVEDSERLRGKIDGGHTKNLFLKNKKNQFFLFSCDENAMVDLKRFSKSIGANNLSFANKDYLEKILGIKPGAVSPLALLNDKNNSVNFYLDRKLSECKIINFHPLVNTITISLQIDDFFNLFLENNKKINIFSLDSYSVVNVL
mgnify:CR=1 FL=1